MRIPVLLSALLLFAACPTALAAETLTLSEALAQALSSQPQLRQASASVSAAEARIAATRSGSLPQVSMSSGYQANTNTVPGAGGMNMGVNLSQLIYDFGQLSSRVEASSASAQAQHESLRATRQQVTQSVRTAFLEVQSARAMMRVATEALANQKRHVEQVRRMVTIGTRAPIDLAQTRKDMANAQVQLIRSENAYAVAKAQLNRAMGREASLDFQVSDEGFPAVAGERLPLETLLEEAIANRPEISMLRAQRQAQTASMEAIRGALRPTLRASAGASNGGNLMTTSPVVGGGLSLSWPLWNGGNTDAQTREAEASLAGLEAQADLLRQQIRLEILEAQLAIQSGEGTVKAAAESVASAQEQLRLAEGRYEAGVGTILELSDAQLALTAARGQQIQEERRLAQARAQLLKALGRS